MEIVKKIELKSSGAGLEHELRQYEGRIESYGQFKNIIFVKDLDGDHILVEKIAEEPTKTYKKTHDGRFILPISLLPEPLSSFYQKIHDLTAKILVLESRLPKKIIVKEPILPLKIMGFSINKGHKGYYYAVKRHKGRCLSVYIGRSLEKAEDRLMSYCTKHQIY